MDEFRLILDASPITFDSWLDDDYDAARPSERLMFVIEPTLADEGLLATESWHAIVGDDPTTTDSAFVCGFVAGALEVWAQVQDKS